MIWRAHARSLSGVPRLSRIEPPATCVSLTMGAGVEGRSYVGDGGSTPLAAVRYVAFHGDDTVVEISGR